MNEILYRLLRWWAAMFSAAVLAGCGAGGGESDATLSEPGLNSNFNVNSNPDSNPNPNPNPDPASNPNPDPDAVPDPDPDPPTAAGAGTGAGGAGRGPAPVPLGRTAEFAILSANELINAGPSLVTGNAGSTYAQGSLIGLSCAEVSGTIYQRDASGPTCMQTDLQLLAVAKADGDTAFNDSMARLPDYTELDGGEIGGRNLGPATYRWSSRVYIRRDLTLTGGPHDVWIFQIAQQLDVDPGVRILLRGGARAENIFWAPTFTVTLGGTSHFEGILLPAAPVLMLNGASLNGRILAEGVHLDQNRVTQPGP